MSERAIAEEVDDRASCASVEQHQSAFVGMR